MGNLRKAGCEAKATTLARLVLSAVATGVALLVACACVRQVQPTVTPERTLLAARTPVPTRVLALPTAPSVAASVEPHAGRAPRTYQGPPVADLAIQSSDPLQATAGETTIYTLTVRNLGPAPASGVVLTDVLPSDVTPLWTQPAQPICGREGRSVGCLLGDLRAGDAVTVSLDLTASGSQGLITSTHLAGVTVTLSVPVCEIDQDASSARVTCRLSRLQPGADVLVRIGISVPATKTGAFAHTSTVAANETDPDGSNNSATGSVKVASVPPVASTAVPMAADLVLQASGPTKVGAGQPFTYTYTVVNRGALSATGVWFEDTVPSDLNLVAYVPTPPRCEQRGDALTCTLRDPDSGEAVAFTLVITGQGGQPMAMGLDPVQPGWPVCWVINERTWLHIVQCELGELTPGQAIRVELAFMAIGVAARTTANTASVRASEPDAHPADNTSTMTITVEAGAESSQP